MDSLGARVKPAKKVRLGDVCKVVLGGTPSTRVPEYWDGDVPWLTPGDMGKTKGLYVSETSRKLTRAGLQTGSTLFSASSIVVSTRAPIGYVLVNTVPMCTNQGCKTLVPDATVHAEYLCFYLRSRIDELNSLGTGTTFKELSTRALQSVRIPLPSLPAQRRIAAALDLICELKKNAETRLAKLDLLAKSLFVEAFGDPVENPKGWETRPILSMGECRNGLNFAPNETGYKVACIGVSDFKDRAVITKDIALQQVSLAARPPVSQLLKDGDFLFVRSNGNKALVGRCVLVLREGEETTFSGFCIRYRLNPDAPVATRFLLHFLRSDPIRRRLAGRGANIQNMRQKTLEPLRVPMPPLPLQRAFAERVECIDKAKATLRETIDRLDTLYRSKLQEYFG